MSEGPRSRETRFTCPNRRACLQARNEMQGTGGGRFSPLYPYPSSVTQCNYNPGPNSWDKNTISCQSDAFFLSLLPPSAVLVLYIQVLFQQNQHSLGERVTAEIHSYNNIDPSFLRGTMQDVSLPKCDSAFYFLCPKMASAQQSFLLFC